jgi:hypothetical protein
MFEGDIARPFGIDAVLIRRECRSEEDRELWWDELDDLVLPGMSRILSFRPVVGSVVWSLAGS